MLQLGLCIVSLSVYIFFSVEAMKCYLNIWPTVFCLVNAIKKYNF